MSFKKIVLESCLECPFNLDLYMGHDELQVLRCKKTDLVISEEVVNEKMAFPVTCPLEDEEDE